MPFDRDHRFRPATSRRQWRHRRKHGRAQRSELRTHIDEVRSRLNACHMPGEPESAAQTHDVSRTWGTLSLRAAQDERRSRQSLASLSRPMHRGPYSRAVHSRRVTGILLAVLGDPRPDPRIVSGLAVILGEEMGDPLRNQLFYMRLRVWLAPYFADHQDLHARLSTWLRTRRGDAGERTA